MQQLLMKSDFILLNQYFVEEITSVLILFLFSHVH